MARTTYVDVEGRTYGFTPETADGVGYVAVTTATASLGLYRIERFGPDPLTPSGAVRRAAVRHLLSGEGRWLS